MEGIPLHITSMTLPSDKPNAHDVVDFLKYVLKAVTPLLSRKDIPSETLNKALAEWIRAADDRAIVTIEPLNVSVDAYRADLILPQ